ncbi:putative GTP-binding protein YjiA (plasmid) [Variovorax sp. SRS16]|uniref:CobW family GTP-binding protein n=1 Tax=Variovorax sp. SRS16 TaxID=282217 RepID=UPI001316D175|nr:GTP-binding protein [Variovorax sp. SRS16]VTU46621.1 putative GTP-binding protein YjiA [Variovorax sp. SRS16]
MTAAARIPVDLVTGFLGSGKTTLVNAVLRDASFAGAMVIVNEFGEVGLDHVLMSAADDQVLLLDSGCLCCAASGTLRDTLIDLFARRSSGGVPPFDRIIVETSGLAHPGPLVASLLGDSALKPRCVLAQVLTLVDAVNGAATLARYAEAQRQVAFADRVLISKTDIAEPAQASDLVSRIRELNPAAEVARWQRGDSPSRYFAPAASAAPHATAVHAEAWLRGPLRPQYAQAGDGVDTADVEHDHGTAFRQVSTHVLEVPGPIDWPIYAAWTQALSARLGARLLRCKGLVALGDDGAPWVVQGVQGYFAPPERLAAWPASVPHGFLVCIGESITRAELDAIVVPTPSPH